MRKDNSLDRESNVWATSWINRRQRQGQHMEVAKGK